MRPSSRVYFHSSPYTLHDDLQPPFPLSLTTVPFRSQQQKEVTGTVTVNTGGVMSNLTGTYTVESTSLKSVTLSGDTTVDGVAAKVTLTCEG